MAAYRTKHARRALPLLLILMLTAAGARAAESVDSLLSPLPETGVLNAPARLVVNNREVVVFRSTFAGYRPEDRVEHSTERIREAIRSRPRNQTDFTVTSKATELGTLFYIDGIAVFGLTPDDRDKLSGETHDQLVTRTQAKLEDAVAAMVEQRTTSRLVRSIILSVVATVLLVLLLRGLRLLSRWVNSRLSVETLSRKKKISETHVPMFRQLGTLMHGVVKALGIVIALILIDVWLTFVLKQFPYTYPWGDQIDDFLFRALAGIGLAMLRAVPNIVILAIIILIGKFVDRWVRLFFAAVKEGRIDPPGVDAETAIPVQRLVLLLVWVITIAIAYPFIPGSQGVAFKGLSVLLGVMISLGSSNVVSQAASGYMIMFSKALRTNDYVRIGEFEGTIISVGMLSTKLRTARDEEINVPNAVVVGSIVKNYTRLNRETGAPVTTTVTIGYGTPWRQIHAMLLEAAAGTPGLRKEPQPKVLQSALSDFYVEYTLFGRLEVPQTRVAVLSALHANIQDIFNVHGVQIMSPHYEGDPDGKVWVPKDQWYAAPASEERPGAARVEETKGNS